MDSLPKPHSRDWYIISVDSLRGWVIVALIIGAVAGGVWAYREIEPWLLRREASRVIEEARLLARRVGSEEAVSSFQSELRTARQTLRVATVLYEEARYGEALLEGQRSRTILTGIADALLHHRMLGEARFVAVRGGVEIRSGDGGDWRQATGRDLLRGGDYVKTAGNGLAEIIFVDGTLYTVRPNTLFVVTRGRTAPGLTGERAISMEYGWVDLNTSDQASQVSTPGAEARLDRESEGLVAYDQVSESGRFVAYRGGMEVTSTRSRQSVGALEEVTLDGEELSQPKPLPSRPIPLQPEDNLQMVLGEDSALTLQWAPVEGAVRYGLQISRSRLFVDNVIDAQDRVQSKAKVAIRGEGTFVWRVAAYNDEGRQGPWSVLQRFRVAARQPGPTGSRRDSGPTEEDSGPTEQESVLPGESSGE